VYVLQYAEGLSMARQEPRPKYHRRSDLARLQEAATDTPLLITDDGERYVVRAFSRDNPALRAGRYEVVHAYISGYAAAMDHQAAQ
jgi:hypothetical protein